MKISKEHLDKMIKESVSTLTEKKSTIKESPSPALTWGINWPEMADLARRNAAGPKWKIIMKAHEVSNSPEEALALLKSAVATLELHKNKHGQQEKRVSFTDKDEEEMLDFGKFIK